MEPFTAIAVVVSAIVASGAFLLEMTSLTTITQLRMKRFQNRASEAEVKQLEALIRRLHKATHVRKIATVTSIVVLVPLFLSHLIP